MDARETRISKFETPPHTRTPHPRANDTPATPTHKTQGRPGANTNTRPGSVSFSVIYPISQYLDKARLLRVKLSARQACNVRGASKHFGSPQQRRAPVSHQSSPPLQRGMDDNRRWSHGPTQLSESNHHRCGAQRSSSALHPAAQSMDVDLHLLLRGQLPQESRARRSSSALAPSCPKQGRRPPPC